MDVGITSIGCRILSPTIIVHKSNIVRSSNNRRYQHGRGHHTSIGCRTLSPATIVHRGNIVHQIISLAHNTHHIE